MFQAGRSRGANDNSTCKEYIDVRNMLKPVVRVEREKEENKLEYNLKPVEKTEKEKEEATRLLYELKPVPRNGPDGPDGVDGTSKPNPEPEPESSKPEVVTKFGVGMEQIDEEEEEEVEDEPVEMEVEEEEEEITARILNIPEFPKPEEEEEELPRTWMWNQDEKGRWFKQDIPDETTTPDDGAQITSSGANINQDHVTL